MAKPANYRIFGMHMYKLVLIRHGESTWNLENRFTGWTDVPLTDTGVAQARQAGRLLKPSRLRLRRGLHLGAQARHLDAVARLDEMDRTWLPVLNDWRLNERHYGALQGLNKADMAKQYGDEQVLIWRRSYDTPPPALDAGDPRSQRSDLRYAGWRPGRCR
jgi:2,3-bisphosphoglycerate-dependent phosphoglycerate mutase